MPGLKALQCVLFSQCLILSMRDGGYWWAAAVSAGGLITCKYVCCLASALASAIGLDMDKTLYMHLCVGPYLYLSLTTYARRAYVLDYQARISIVHRFIYLTCTNLAYDMEANLDLVRIGLQEIGGDPIEQRANNN